MGKVVLIRANAKNKQNLLAEFLQGLGIKQPQIHNVMKIFVKNKNQSLPYDFLVKKTKQKRSNLVKICQKLNQLGLIEKTYFYPKGKRWQRAYIFSNFSSALNLTRNKTKNLFASLTHG